MAVNVRPTGDHVLVRPDDESDEGSTASGIVIPDTAKDKPQRGTIEAIGTGRYNDHSGQRVPMDVTVGDKVMYAKYSGSEFKFEGTKYLILSEKDILAVLAKN